MDTCHYSIQGQYICKAIKTRNHETREHFNQIRGYTGTYIETCSNCVVHNRETMVCSCDGNTTTSSIHLPTCTSANIISTDGKLRCS